MWLIAFPKGCKPKEGIGVKATKEKTIMPKEIDGEEYYTKEEVEQQIAEKDEEIQDKLKEIEEASGEEKKKLEEELETMKTENEKLKNKDHNFKKLREKTDTKDDEINALKETTDSTSKKLDELIASNKEEVRSDFFEDVEIDPDSKEGKELIAKIDHYYEKVGKDAQTKAQIKSALKEALILARQGEQGVDAVQNAVGTGGGTKETKANDNTKETPFSKELGVTADDRKKHDLTKRQDIF